MSNDHQAGKIIIVLMLMNKVSKLKIESPRQIQLSSRFPKNKKQ